MYDLLEPTFEPLRSGLVSRLRSNVSRVCCTAWLLTRALPVEWGTGEDLRRASELDGRYASLELGLVDASGSRRTRTCTGGSHRIEVCDAG